MMYWYGPGIDTWAYVLMTVSMLVFWALVIAGVVALIRYLGRPATSMPVSPTCTPEQLLGARFARGEIDEEEYRRRLEALRGGHAVTGA